MTFTNAEVIEYRGGPRHITIFFKDNKDKYYVCYARTYNLDVQIEEEYRDWVEDMKIKFRVAQNKDAHIKIPIITNKNAIFNLICIENKKQFELVDEVVASLLEE